MVDLVKGRHDDAAFTENWVSLIVLTQIDQQRK